MRRFPALLLAALLAFSIAGCSNRVGLEGREAEAAVEANPVETMEPAQKRAEIDATFPIEVPVAAGRVVRGKAQGSDAWDYELLVDSTPRVIADWYRQAYLARGWMVSEERPLENGALELTFAKGQAQSRVTVSPEGEYGRVTVILGVGSPVLQTQ